MNHYPRHVGDWMRDTAHLSEVEECIYSRMLDMYYSREKPLPADTAATCRLVRANSREAKAAVSTILGEFFALQDDGWHQSRCDKELAKYSDKRAKASASVSARWEKRNTEVDTSVYTNVLPTNNERNTNQNQNQNQKLQPHTSVGGERPVVAREQPPATKAGPRSIDAPTDAHRAIAEKLGIPCDSEFDRYRDWLSASGKRHRNESAGFANWLRRAADFKARDAQKITAQDRRADAADQMFKRGKYAVASSSERDISGIAERLD